MTAHISPQQAERAFPIPFLPAMAARAVITGIGLTGSAGQSPDALARAAEDGTPPFRTITRFDTSWCETKIGAQIPESEDEPWRASPRTAWMDRGAWYALRALDLTLADAALDLKRFARERIAVVIGTCHAGFVTQETLFERRFGGAFAGTKPLDVLPILSSHVAAVIATRIGAAGPRRTISTACASSTGALGVASDLIRRGEADLVITGGVDTLSLSIFAGFNSLGALAPGGCTPFSGTPGITLGEGAALFALERLDGARARGARFYGETLGYALNGDAYHATAPDENGNGIERVMRAALRNAEIGEGAIDYVSAHGTGTTANDRAETAATARVFGTGTPASAPKSILGHTIGACGAFEIALTLAMAERGLLVPTLRFEATREDCRTLDFVPNAARAAVIDTMLFNNYGFGGANAAAVLRRSIGETVLAAPQTSARVVVTGAARLAPDAGSRTLTDASLPAALKRTFGRASPMIKYAIVAGLRALERAGLAGDRADEIGLVMAAITGAQRTNEKYMESVFVDGPAQASAQYFAYSANNAATGQVSIACDLQGYNCTLTGGAGAMAYAFSLIADRRQRQIAVVASDELTPLLDEVYACAGLAVEGCGAVGEGAVAFVIESLEAARARNAPPLAEILGFGEAQDATFTGVRRDGDALARAIRAALAQAGLLPAEVAHAIRATTPSPRFAEAERAALARVFGDRLPQVRALEREGALGAACGPLAALVVAAEGPALSLVYGIDVSGVSYAAIVKPNTEARDV